jgi:hypothetical protein
MRKFTILHVLVLATAAYWLSACATTATYRVNPRLAQQARKIHSVALLPTEIKVYQIDAGGVREEIEAWSAQARNNVIRAVEQTLRTRMNAAVKIVTDEALGEEMPRLRDTRALYSAVSAMIFLHTVPNPNSPSHFFEEKLKKFDYSLGSDVQNLAPEQDALLLLDAEDHVWTGGRQVLQALGVILGIGAAVATGAVVIPQLGGGASISAALVDSHTGDILWINTVASGAGKDLRDSVGATELVVELFKDLSVIDDRRATKESR